MGYYWAWLWLRWLPAILAAVAVLVGIITLLVIILSENTNVVVTPQDYGAVPVQGTLQRLTHAEIAIRREDKLAGEVVVHFPRAGYQVEEV